MMGRERDYAEGNLKGDEATGAFLAAAVDVLLPGLDWQEFDADAGRVRSVSAVEVRARVHPLLLTAWEREAATPAHAIDERVYLDTGRAFSPSNRSKERKRIERESRGYAALAPVALSGRLYTLLASTPARTFARIPERVLAALTAAQTLTTKAARLDAERALREIADEPVQRYGFSPYAVRLFPSGAGVASVATPLRRVLLSDAVELDLASSQLAIAANDWRRDDGTRACPLLYGFLANGRSFWPDVLAHMGLLYDEAAKRAVKAGTYATVFGMSARHIPDAIRDEYEALTGRRMDRATAERFLTHPLVTELLEARDAELARIRAAGYVVDVFGRTLVQGRLTFGDGVSRTVYGAKAAGSLLAQRTQARELWLLEPLIGLAEREATKGSRAEWRILAWQHDGVSLWFRHPEERGRHIKRIQTAVSERAGVYGYPTRLEIKFDKLG